MKIERKKLTAALNRLNSARDRTTTIPVLKCVKLTETRSRITLEATDLVRTVVVEVAGAPPAPKDAAHSCLVDFDTLYKTVRTAPKDVTDIGLSVLHDTAVTITAGKLKLAANASKRLSDWPEPDSSPAHIQSWSVEADDLKEWLDHCVSSISTEEVRYYLNGVYFDGHEKHGDEISIVATDGHRMAVHKAKRPEGLVLGGDETGFIVRRECALAWRDMIKRGEWQDTVTFTKQGQTLTVESSKSQTFETSFWQTSLIDGAFPDWERVVSQDQSSYAATLFLQELTDAVKQAVALKLTRNVFRFDWCDDGAIIHGQIDDDMNNQFILPVGSTGETVRSTSYDCKYFMDVCNTFAGAEALRFSLYDTITVVTDRDRDDKYIVLMHMRG